MGLTICCPTPTAIESAVTVLNPCPEDLGQIQKMVFWRRGNTIESVATAIISTTWTTLLTSTGSDKAIVTPFMAAVVIPPSEAREFGGGNETHNGSPHRKGGASTPVTANMYAIVQDTTIANLKKLRCETLDVIFINEANQFGYSDGGAATFGGFEVAEKSLFVSDKGIGGFDDSDHNVIMFNLKPNWSDTLHVSTVTDFALDMVNA
ncbi:hypothetical protein KAR91_14420 [Candidatus Pacearchaeota archaeon]|nr:hypothetical protein [Candidatus Pacearchaeota archaeon]